MALPLLFLLSTLAFAGPTEFLPVIQKPGAETKKLQAAKAADFPKLLEKITGLLLYKEYQNGPLGEEKGEDPDPLYRLDVFDCTTFLETVMANALCTEAGTARPACLERKMQAIRYGGKEISFASRNHIPELDWLPNNVRKGFLRDLHGTLFPDAPDWKSAAPVMDREAWLATKTKEPVEKATRHEAPPLHFLPFSFFFEPVKLEEKELAALKATLEAAKKEFGEKKQMAGVTEEEKAELDIDSFHADLDFLKKTQRPIEERLRAIPSGTVLNLVHAPWKGPGKARLLPMITHQGLILQLPDGAYIRHAAPNNKHVSSQKLGDYLRRYLRTTNYRGISLYQILPPVL